MKEPLILDFDVNAFSLQAVQKACLRFSDIASFEVQLQPHGDKASIVVTASPLSSKSEEGLENLEKLLRNEALDQQLREQIRSQTEGTLQETRFNPGRSGIICKKRRSMASEAYLYQLDPQRRCTFDLYRPK